MKYGYFKSVAGMGGILFKGPLEYNYKQLSTISGIKVYYDHCGKKNTFLYRLLAKLRHGDSLYVLNIHDLGTKPSTVFSILEGFKKDNIKFFIKDKEIYLDKVFEKIENDRTFNKEHLNSKLYDSDILNLVYDELAKF